MSAILLPDKESPAHCQAYIAQINTNLLAIPEIVEVYCTNEAYDLFVKIYARNNDHLLTLIQTQIKPLGLILSKIIISFRTVYNKQLTILPK